MTSSFLNIIAKDLFTRTNGHLENITVVFPNKRANLFMNQQIAELSDSPVWSPKYTTISDLFQSMSSLIIADPIILISYLYEIYQSVAQNNESFDHFYSWGEVLLKDFEDIDSNMVNSKALFANIADLEAMTSFDFLTDEQLDAIKQFFTAFSKNEKSELHIKFLNMWKLMPEIYEKFHKTLEENGIAYEGMMKRKIIENFNYDDINTDTTYAFVGFNALSKTEKELFKFFKKHAKTLFYWDYDSNSDPDEASQHIQQNIVLFGQDFKPEETEKNKQKNNSINIQILSSPTDNAQCKYIGQWIKETIKKDEPLNKTAIILCNENLLNSVLHSVPSHDDEGNEIQYNITMGYPLQETPVNSYIMALINLQSKGWKDDNTLKYKAVIQLLQHPFVMSMANDHVHEILQKIKDNNIIFPEIQLFENHPGLKFIFTHQDNCHDTIKYIRDCIVLATKVYTEDLQRNDNQLLNESLFNGYTMTNRLLAISDEGKLPIQNIDILSRLIRHIIQTTSVPFHGEPASGIQIMGVLETRNLDFNNIIMLSMEEGTMPKPPQQSSFIPYVLKKAHGMPTIEHYDSIYSYYFHRLFHHVQKLTLLYNNTTEGIHKGEMSRYLMQLKLNGVPCGEIVSHNIEPVTTSPIRLKDENENKENEVFTSPSAINTYIDCPYKYYLRYICGLKEPETLSEDVDNIAFGNIFHYVMEHIYRPFIGRGQIQSFQINEIKKDNVLLQKIIDQAFTEILNKDNDNKTHNYSKGKLDGEMLLTYEVITQYVKKQLDIDSKLCPMTILAVEKDLNEIDINGEAEIANGFKFSGIIDREDIVTIDGKQIHRVVDYKTSSQINNKTNDILTLFQHNNLHTGYILQTLYYCEALVSSGCKDALSPALLFIKKNTSETDYSVMINKEPIYDYKSQCREIFLMELKALINKIRNPENPFIKNPEEKKCELCPFLKLCEADNKNQ
ncbi:MAG: PD-(D/E)XK nuclease family protein [Bacteroidaceae bacterium]|nr:PD-(D/E)XK nuclease family protein [Bacteroidaceae bacterium]